MYSKNFPQKLDLLRALGLGRCGIVVILRLISDISPMLLQVGFRKRPGAAHTESFQPVTSSLLSKAEREA